tara:strand:+ start:1709 stop:2104 length:396 start_codon:yes stop_codon:yes gene_type:complete
MIDLSGAGEMLSKPSGKMSARIVSGKQQMSKNNDSMFVVEVVLVAEGYKSIKMKDYFMLSGKAGPQGRTRLSEMVQLAGLTPQFEPAELMNKMIDVEVGENDGGYPQIKSTMYASGYYKSDAVAENVGEKF